MHTLWRSLNADVRNRREADQRPCCDLRTAFTPQLRGVLAGNLPITCCRVRTILLLGRGTLLLVAVHVQSSIWALKDVWLFRHRSMDSRGKKKAVLWRSRLPAGGQATPMTHPGGRRPAVLARGGWRTRLARYQGRRRHPGLRAAGALTDGRSKLLDGLGGDASGWSPS